MELSVCSGENEDMKLEIFIGKKDVQTVKYKRGLSIPLTIGGKIYQLYLNLGFISFFYYK